MSAVVHPTFGLSPVTLEMVKTVRVDTDSITVELVLGCPGCPSGEAVLAQVNRKLRDLLPPSGRVTVTLVPEKWSPPWEGYWFTK